MNSAMAIVCRALALVFLFTFGAIGSAQAVLITIDFESDSPGNKGPSFVSVDSPLLTFSDQLLNVGNFSESIGQGLATFGTNLGLNMDFSTTVDGLSMAFGNDDPRFREDRAVLTAFLNNVQIGQTVLIYNKNDAADQTIGISNIGLFDEAHLIYMDSNFNAVSNLAEIVDNVTFNTCVGPVIVESIPWSNVKQLYR